MGTETLELSGKQVLGQGEQMALSPQPSQSSIGGVVSSVLIFNVPLMSSGIYDSLLWKVAQGDMLGNQVCYLGT